MRAVVCPCSGCAFPVPESAPPPDPELSHLELDLEPATPREGGAARPSSHGGKSDRQPPGERWPG